MGQASIPSSDSVAQLRALIERAPFEEDGWSTALHHLAVQTGSSRAQLIALGDKHIAFDWISDPPDGFYEEASKIDFFHPDVNYRIATTDAPMKVTWEDHYDQARRIHTDEAYMELARKFDFEHGAQIVLSQKPGAFFGLALLRGHSEGRTSEAERAILAELAPSVLTSIRLQESIEHAGVGLLQGSLEAMQTPALVLDALGTVRFVSASAQPLLGPDTLQVKDGALRAANPEIDRALGRRLAPALGGIDPGPADLWIRGGPSLILLDVRPLPRPARQLGIGARAIVTLRPLVRPHGATMPAQGGRALEHHLEHQGAMLANALELTQAEGEVVALLGQGLARRDVAALRGVSPQTVNTQLRTIFLKCEVNRESELVATARSILDMLGH